MNPLHALSRGICDLLVGYAPQAFIDSLRKCNYEMAIRELNKAYLFDWSHVSLSEHPECFDDLLSMFQLSPMGRGIIRQDFDEAAALFRAVRRLSDEGEARGVEIGRFSGGSTLLLAVAVGEKGRLISIDIEPQDDATLEEVLKKTHMNSRVELVVADANTVKCQEKLDFIFIDGDHSYEGAKRDHNLWGGRVKKGGLIVHHDMASSRQYSTQWHDLARLRGDILEKQNSQIKLIEEAGSMSIFEKISDTWVEI